MATNTTGIMTFTAAETLTAHLRVKLDASQNVVKAGADDLGIGTVIDKAVSGEAVFVRLWNAPGTRKLVCADAVTIGASIYGAADGKITDTYAADRSIIGEAIEAGSGDAAIIEVVLKAGFGGGATGTLATPAITDLTDVDSKTGTGAVVVMQESPTLNTPTVANLTNMQHTHGSAAGGGTITLAAAGITFTAPDKLISRTASGAGSGVEISCTAAGRALIDDAAASDQRTTLGLGNASTANFGTGAGNIVSGTDARLSDKRDPNAHTHLASGSGGTLGVAALAFTATDKISGRMASGAGTGEEITCTAAGRALLDDAAASDQRTTLGLGTAALLADPITLAHGGTGLTASGTANQVLGMNAGATAAEFKSIAAGTNINTIVHTANTITINGKTDPTINNFTNAGHDHVDASGGGQLLSTAFFASGVTGSGLVVLSTSPVLVTPRAAVLYGSSANGGTLTLSATSGTVGNILFCGTGTTAVATLITATPTLQGVGGFVVQGGSAASENLTLSATAHGTPGNIYLCATAATAAATVNQYGLGVSAGVADATHAVYISKAATNVALRIDNTNAAGATTSASIVLSHGTSTLQLGKVSASYTPAYGILAGDSYFSYVAASFISNSYHRWVCYDTDYRERMRLTGVAASSTLQIVHGVAGATSYASLQLTNSANSGNVLITSTTWTPAYGENANELVVSAGSNVSSLNLHTVSAAPIYFTTTQNLRMTILAGSNTLQGNAGLTLQGGAATGNAITISSNASNDGAINIGVAATDKVGFYGVTAVVRPAAFTQTYSTASRTHAALTTSDLDATATTQTTPWGFATQAQGDAIATKVNQLIDDVENAKQVLNQVLDDLQLNGLLQ